LPENDHSRARHGGTFASPRDHPAILYRAGNCDEIIFVALIVSKPELPRAAQLIRWNDPRHYLREFWSGNVRFTPFVKAVGLALFNELQKKAQGATASHRETTDRKLDESPPLDLQPGDIVRVKPKQEIEKTLKKSKKPWPVVRC
jgi:hypothetical protein